MKELNEIELAIAAIEEERRLNFEKAKQKEELRLKLFLASLEEPENPDSEDFEN